MTRKFILLLAGAALFVGLCSPASASVDAPDRPAHATSSEASAACAATRPIALGQFVLHAHLIAVAVGYRRYRCESWNFVVRAPHGCFWDTAYIDGVGPFGPLQDPPPVCY